MQPENNLRQSIEKRSIFYLGCLASILIFFQANIVVNQFSLNLNLSDLLAILSGSILALDMRKHLQVSFILPKTKVFLLLTICAFTYALACGWYKFGLTSYALISKFLGLFVLLGYAFLGAAFKLNFRYYGPTLLCKVMLSTLTIIVLIKLCINLIFYTQVLGSDFYINPILSGYANNRNAFAIQLLCVAFLAIIYLKESDISISFLNAAVILTYSRSALVALFALLFFVLFTKIIARKRTLKIALITGALIVLILSMEWLCAAMSEYIWHLRQSTGGHSVGTVKNWFELNQYSYETSNNQRIYTLLEAVSLWLKSPFTGIGLGGFVWHEFNKNALFLVIHNTFLWILTEFGLIGASVFIWYGILTLKYFYTRYVSIPIYNWLAEEQALAGLLIIFGAMGSAHEIFYQRIFWLIFGLCIVSSKKTTKIAIRKDEYQFDFTQSVR